MVALQGLNSPSQNRLGPIPFSNNYLVNSPVVSILIRSSKRAQKDRKKAVSAKQNALEVDGSSGGGLVVAFM